MMIGIIAIVVPILAVTGFWIATTWKTKYTHILSVIAEKLGIDFEKYKNQRIPDITETVDNFSINLKEITREKAFPLNFPLQITIFYNLPFHFFITQESKETKIRKTFGKKDFEIGDDEFDKMFLLDGEPADLLIVCNPDMRHLLKEINKNSIEFSFHDERFKARFSKKQCQPPDQIADYIKQLLFFLTQLQDKDKMTELLIYNLKMEYSQQNKIRIIERIDSEKYVKYFHKNKILNVLLKDSDPIIKIHAAALCGERGCEYLVQYFEMTGNVDEKLLIARKMRRFNTESAMKFFLDNLTSNDKSIQLQVIKTVGYIGSTIFINALHKITDDPSTDKLSYKYALKSLQKIRDRARRMTETDGWVSVADKDDSGALTIADDESDGHNP